MPGRTIQSVVKESKDLLLFVKIKASWSTVQRGQTIRVLADGPDGEQWVWKFQTRNKKPLRDPTNYQACLKLKTRTGKFLRRMQERQGLVALHDAHHGRLARADSTSNVTVRSR